MKDLVVLMSVYHKDKLDFLKQSVQSIIDQTFPYFDFYIVFDGPVSDEIEEFFSSLKDERIRLFRLKENRGLAKALNFLLEIVIRDSQYEFIARMDADDISMPMRFEKQRSFLVSDPEVSCVGSWYQEIDDSGNILSNRRLPISHDKLRKLYFTRTPFAHPSVMYRRGLIERAGFYPTDTILMEDNVLWGKALKAGLKFANIPEYLFKFRIDKIFFNRRSGIKYGWNYIITRNRINRILEPPLYLFFFSILKGFVKMMPAFILRYSYGIKKIVKVKLPSLLN